MNTTITQQDYYRHTGKWVKFPFFHGYFKPGYRFTYYLRKCQQYSTSHLLGIIYRLILRHYQILYGIQISPKTEIGAGFYIGHWGTIVINPKAKIGKNCNIAHGVTIGQTNRGEKRGVPTIGDEVWIGTNAVIVGDITIGNNVLIAPNAFVIKNIPNNSIVTGNPAIIVSNREATLDYINHKV